MRLTSSRHEPLVGQIDKIISNLYLAGDYCRSQIDVASLEGAMHTGIWAAHALSLARRAEGDWHVAQVAEPIRPVRFDPQQIEEVRRHLERWAPLAARRSRLVKDDLLTAVRIRRQRPVASAAPAEAPTIVEIWDEKGFGKDPVQDTDGRFEVVKKRDAWLIREFPRTIPERGAKS